MSFRQIYLSVNLNIKMLFDHISCYLGQVSICVYFDADKIQMQIKKDLLSVSLSSISISIDILQPWQTCSLLDII